ncbi:MAG TPA: riboflavin synthase [Thermoanaerobaculia bacterium]|nr:riboflavin synthase [Thermoanaerobaculia bacterium]
MFTGLVVETGRLSESPRPSPRGGVMLSIEHGGALDERLPIGASLAVAGVCLTVVESLPGRCEVELSPETLARTQLGRLRAGDRVNLEPALRAGDAMGGHWVQGHVDGLVELVSRRDLEEHSRFEIGFPPAFDRWIAEKGSVALDGVSLTVAARAASRFDVALIPHTLTVTTLGVARPGDRFHFEADVLAKYVERAVAARWPGGGGRA